VLSLVRAEQMGAGRFCEKDFIEKNVIIKVQIKSDNRGGIV